METLALAGAVAGSISAASQISKSLLLLRKVDNEVERTELEITLSLQKIREWQENWSGQVRSTKVSAKVLWGARGWETIRRLLEEINDLSSTIEERLREIHKSLDNQPRFRWKRAIALVGRQRRVERYGDLRILAGRLSKFVDQLWIISESLFDSLHGLLALESKPTERDELLRSAVQSRFGSLKLYNLCLAQTEDCNLEMNLRTDNSLDVCYRLVAEPREKELRTLLVTTTKEADNSTEETTKVVESMDDLQLFQPSSRPTFIKIPGQVPDSPQYLRIAEAQTFSLEQNPQSLAGILKNMESPTYKSTQKYLDTEAKVELAFKVIECGLFLLGTPWFSSLSSISLRQLEVGKEHLPTFMLRTQTLDLKDLVSDDPGALAENSQLFRLGVILMDIALGSLDNDVDRQAWDDDPSRISKLALVEKAIGTQYCRATAFCLQYRRDDRFPGPDKYDSQHFAEWETYLEGFLVDYHAQVYLRLLELRLGRKLAATSDKHRHF